MTLSIFMLGVIESCFEIARTIFRKKIPVWLLTINFTTMRFIPRKIHGILDYVVGIILIAAPWIFNFADGGAKTWVPVILGVAALVYSLFTNYELGAIKKLPFKAHLTLDLLSGILLALSPWLFGFADEVYLPHLILGILEIGASIMTKQSETDSSPNTVNSTRTAAVR